MWQHPRLYILLLAVAAAGAVLGWLAPAGAFGASPAQLGPYVDAYLSCLPRLDMAAGRELWRYLAWNGGLLLILCVCGLYTAGPALVCSLIFVRSFTFAFADFYLAQSRSSAGLALLIALLLPQALALLAALRMGRSALSLCRRKEVAGLRDRREYREYIDALLLCAPALLLGALGQAYLTPLVLRLAYAAD